MKEVKPRSILFVCTGNVFRSVSAAYLLEKYLKDNNLPPMRIESAGTNLDIPQSKTVVGILGEYGIDAARHRAKPLTQRLLSKADITVAMAHNHVSIIRGDFKHTNVNLFNEIAHGTLKDVPDIDTLANPTKEAMSRHFKKIIKALHKDIPLFYKRLNDYLLFTDFARHRATHSNGYPFIPLHETKHTLTFMAINIPQKQDGHLLVIPKRRYQHLEDIPKHIQKELIHTASDIGKALKRTHGGYNILINNDSAAGQTIHHTHVHVIPRNKNDAIEIEQWEPKKLTKQSYLRMNKRLQETLKSLPQTSKTLTY